MARCKGFEPLTFWFVAKHSIRLSYRHMSFPTKVIISHFGGKVKWYLAILQNISILQMLDHIARGISLISMLRIKMMRFEIRLIAEMHANGSLVLCSNVAFGNLQQLRTDALPFAISLDV